MTDELPNEYQIGDPVEITGTWTDVSGTVTDPSGIIIAILKTPSQSPAQGATQYGYGYNFSAQGAWDAAANSPALYDGTGTAGQYYTVNAAGSQIFGGQGIAFATQDWVYFDGARWRKLPNAAHPKVSANQITKRSTGIYDCFVGPLILYLGISGKFVYEFFATQSDGDPQGAGPNTMEIDPAQVTL